MADNQTRPERDWLGIPTGRQEVLDDHGKQVGTSEPERDWLGNPTGREILKDSDGEKIATRENAPGGLIEPPRRITRDKEGKPVQIERHYGARTITERIRRSSASSSYGDGGGGSGGDGGSAVLLILLLAIVFAAGFWIGGRRTSANGAANAIEVTSAPIPSETKVNLTPNGPIEQNQSSPVRPPQHNFAKPPKQQESLANLHENSKLEPPSEPKSIQIDSLRDTSEALDGVDKESTIPPTQPETIQSLR